MQRVPMTLQGHQRLEAELKHLKSVERPAVIQAIAEARAHGDLSENAEYHAAKEKQGFLEGEMRSLEDKIARSQVVDISKLSGEKIVFGATVKLLNVDTDEEVTYRIVGEDEADTKSGSISYKAPIAKALIGRKVGDEVVFNAPGGSRTYEVIEVDFIA